MQPMVCPSRVIIEANVALKAIQPEIDVAKSINETTRMRMERMIRRTELEEPCTPRLRRLDDDRSGEKRSRTR